MTKRNLTLPAGLLLAVLAAGSTFGATPIISDNYNVTGGSSSGTGFALNTGVNTNINPPTTRLTGTAAANLRYLQTATARVASKYDISSSKLRVQTENTIGRFTLSANGTTPFNFASALGTLVASPTNPAVYDVKIGMQNNATGTPKFSFGFATAEGDVTTWDFGIQMYRATSGDDFYTIQKRIDSGSAGVTDVNAVMATLPPGSGGSLTNFLIRVTDAGAESGADYHSRVQVSTNDGTSWIYDTTNDVALANGFRFDGAGRYFIFDQAGNTSGNVFYDNFSVTWNSGPTAVARTWTGGGADDNWSSGANWDGAVPVNGNMLVFDGTTRQTNTNDISGLWVPWVTFNNGGFALYGNVWTNIGAITNLAGTNMLGGDLAWDFTDAKTWSVASGSELVLNNTNTVDVNGDHYLYGGGTLRQNGAINIGQASTANPAFVVNDGAHIVDGGSFTSRGGYRIGSLAAAAAGAQTVLTNGAVLTITATSGNIRVGDSANPVTSRLVIDHSTLTTLGARLCIPFAAGATGEVAQVGGTVSGCRVSFSDSGAGKGTYTLKDGTLETYNIAEGTSGALSYMYFDNAVLRALSGSTNAFMTGLNRAEIQSGGLTIDAQAEIVVAQKLIGAGALTKSGFYTVTLTGANAYSGDTLVNEGKLVLPTGQTYNAPIRVADSAELGVLLQTSGASLTNGSLSLGSTGFGISTLSFDLGSFSNPTVPLMTATNLSANGVVNVNVANGLQLRTGQFVLVDYEGSIGGDGFTYFTLANLPPGVQAELVNNTNNTSIDLNITGAPGYLWTGATSTDWDTTTQNWISQLTGSPSTYSDGLLAEFRDGAVTGVVNLAIYPVPSAIVVSNDMLPYVWLGGAITTPILKKFGPGSVTRVEGQADLIDGIELNAGSYVASNYYDGTFATVLTDTSAGTGTFVKQGSGTLTVSSTNDTYNGKTLIQEGTLKLGATRSLGTTTATIIITNGGTLDLNDHQPVQPVIVSGDGVDGQGAIIDSTTATAVEYNLRDVMMTGDTTFGCPNNGRWDLRANGGHGPGPGLRGNGYKLTKVGSGLVSIANQRTTTGYWRMNLGDIVVNQGNLAFAESLDLGNPSASLTVNSGAILQLYDLGLTNPIARTITMNDARLNASGTTGDTNVVNGGFQLTGANTIWCDQAHLIINGPIGGSGALCFFASNPGTLILNGTNTYLGDTIITNGTLGGSGVLAGNLIVLGGTNSPGASVGTFTVNGDATLAGTTVMELDRSLSPNSDRWVVGGALAFGGTLKVVVAAGAPAPQAGDVYHLFNKGGSGAFAPISLPDLSGLPGDLAWDTTRLTSDGILSVTGTATPPTIGSVSIGGGSFQFSGTGGLEGNPYHVVTSTEVTAPLPTWVPVASNIFGPGGTFTFSTNIIGGAPKAFFQVVVP